MDIDRDGIPLQEALPRLLPAPAQVAVVLENALAANWLRYIKDQRRRISICRMARNPNLGDVPIETNFIVETIRRHERSADFVRQRGFQRQLVQGKLEGYGELTGNPLDGLKKFPKTAWRLGATNSPEFNFRGGWVRHKEWSPEVVHAVVLVDPARTTGSQPAFNPSSVPVARSRYAAVDSKALKRMAELFACGCGSARANAETLYEEFILQGMKPTELGASRQAATDRWRKAFVPDHSETAGR